MPKKSAAAVAMGRKRWANVSKTARRKAALALVAARKKKRELDEIFGSKALLHLLK